MDKAYEYAKSAVINYKLERCCCLAPIRVGVFIIAYINLFISVLSLVGTGDGGITPPLMEIQDQILEDNASKAIGILAYSVELAFSTLLQCAMYRNDIVLLRVYVYFLLAQIITSVLIYSMVIVMISLLTKILIFANIVFNGYTILIVRSAIVEIKENTTNEKNGHVVLYSMVKVPPEEEKPQDIEAPVEPSETDQEITPDEKETPAKLETVTENPKE